MQEAKILSLKTNYQQEVVDTLPGTNGQKPFLTTFCVNNGLHFSTKAKSHNGDCQSLFTCARAFKNATPWPWERSWGGFYHHPVYCIQQDFCLRCSGSSKGLFLQFIDTLWALAKDSGDAGTGFRFQSSDRVFCLKVSFAVAQRMFITCICWYIYLADGCGFAVSLL